jgi:hypothetical protein
MSITGPDSLRTLQENADTQRITVPETRMKDAQAAQNFAKRLVDNDGKRSWKRSRVNGIVDGNPPYARSKLLAANRADACNVNWGIARAYMENGAGALYDLVAESPGIFAIRTSYGTDEERELWSNVLCEEADKTANDDPAFDYNLQQSQWNTILHGCGPYFFEDGFKPFPRAFQSGDLKVPERTRSDTLYWDACTLRNTYYPPQLYDFIKKEKSAEKLGWDVAFTKLVIAHASAVRNQNGLLYDWEWYQQEMKNNSLTYYDDSKVVYLAHVLWKEFDGRITHAIVQEQSSAATPDEPVKYLFIKIGRYKTWDQCIHPMYYDRGNGGYHHSVTGLGVKMYSAMDYQNRLLCNLADKAFAPKILFKPTTTESSQKFQMQTFGDYAVLNSNWDWQQTGVAGLANEGLAMNQQVSELMQSNLSSYRQQMPMKQQGNPITARQVMYDATQQATLTKTSYNRWYKQEDRLCAEIVRRLCNLNSTNSQAKDFQDRCRRRGVPDECFGRIEKVEAVRVIGQGSAFMRRAAIDALMPFAGALPEDGRGRLLQDKIAAEAGIAAVKRYFPVKSARMAKMATEQDSDAAQQVAAMKVGVKAVITGTQNPVIYATAFLRAASEAARSLTEGANPTDVLAFLNIIGPAIYAHLSRFAQDPTRQAVWRELFKQWQELAKMTDGLKEQVMKMTEAQQQQRQASQEAMTDAQLDTFKVTADIANKTAKTQAALKQTEERHLQKMAIADAEAANKIRISQAEAQRPERPEDRE